MTFHDVKDVYQTTIDILGISMTLDRMNDTDCLHILVHSNSNILLTAI